MDDVERLLDPVARLLREIERSEHAASERSRAVFRERMKGRPTPSQAECDRAVCAVPLLNEDGAPCHEDDDSNVTP
jgi:hypothetical protein